MSAKSLRIALLLVILVMVVHHQFTDKARFASWETPVFVTVFPVNADGSQRAAGYIEQLDESDFDPLVDFIRREAERHGVSLERPMYFSLAGEIGAIPPDPPVDGGFFQRAAWILKLRWWRWRLDDQGTDPDIVVLARYFDPNQRQRLPHSTGVERIRVAIANLFATRAMQGENRVVLMHEILHTLGATDKYDLGSGRPIYPDGYAEPTRDPLHPQRVAEIMAGRIAVSETKARQAESLARVLVGPLTAREIGWTDPAR